MTEPTTTDVAVVEQPQQFHGALSERVNYAKTLAHAGLLPSAYRQQPANVLLAMEYADALRIPYMTVIQSVHIVDGKPTASSALVGALVRKAGHRLRVTGDDKQAVCEIVRADDPDFTFRSEWTIQRAQAAGLTGKGTWKQYPASMLKARAITECARDACPEALSGVSYTAEELGADVPDDWQPSSTATVERLTADDFAGEVVVAETLRVTAADLSAGQPEATQ